MKFFKRCCRRISASGIRASLVLEEQQCNSVYFAFVARHPLTSQSSSSGVIESLNDLYLDLKSTQNSQKLDVSKN